MLKIAVLVSGGGTNLQALLDAQRQGSLSSGQVSLVVSSNETAYALERATIHGVATATFRPQDFPTRDGFCQALSTLLESHSVDLVVLAGFMVILTPSFTTAWAGRIVNVHPSLIPAFCGDGFYGLRVHQAALAYGVKVTGATVHLVSDVVDGGPILLQQAVDVLDDDTPETLQRRVMEQAEWKILPQAVEVLCCKLENQSSAR